MCQVLQISRSGYYDWQGRGESQRSQRDQVLLNAIRKIHHDSKQAYGAIKTWQATTSRSGLWQAPSGAAQAVGRHGSAAEKKTSTGLSVSS